MAADKLPVILDFLLIVADMEVSELLYQSSRQHLIYTGIQPRVESWMGAQREKYNKCSSRNKTDARKQLFHAALKLPNRHVHFCCFDK